MEDIISAYSTVESIRTPTELFQHQERKLRDPGAVMNSSQKLHKQDCETPEHFLLIMLSFLKSGTIIVTSIQLQLTQDEKKKYNKKEPSGLDELRDSCLQDTGTT